MAVLPSFIQIRIEQLRNQQVIQDVSIRCPNRMDIKSFKCNVGFLFGRGPLVFPNFLLCNRCFFPPMFFSHISFSCVYPCFLKCVPVQCVFLRFLRRICCHSFQCFLFVVVLMFLFLCFVCGGVLCIFFVFFRVFCGVFSRFRLDFLSFC